MPLLVRVYIKSSLSWLALSVLLAALIFSGQIREGPLLTPIYYHMFMVGWLTQLVFGVAWWMFPVLSRERPRGSDTAGWTVYGFLNSGLIIRVLCEPAQVLNPDTVLMWLLIVSAFLQMIAGWLFAWNMWPRVKAPKPPPRKAKET